MKAFSIFLSAIAAILMIPSALAQTNNKMERKEPAHLTVAPDLSQQLARFKRVEMPFHSEGLSAREKELVQKLVDASRLLDDIYWRQSDPEGLKLYLSLEGSKNPKDVELRRYLMINGSRFALIDENKPFVGTTPMPPGRGFYPEG